MRPHRPPHIYKDNADYFLTIATFKRQPLFDTDVKKQMLKEALEASVAALRYDLRAWVILDNHLHLLVKINTGSTLPRFVARITGKSTIGLNRSEEKRGRRVWYQYWDRCVRDESDFYTRLNYIHHNPIKHGYVNDMSLYPFSSYHEYLETRGKEWLDECFQRYPIVDFIPEEGMD